MRAPYSWLESYCRSGLAPADLADRLTMSGTKVEALHRIGVPDVSEFVVGRVLSAERHPDADRLTVCEVDVGGSTSTMSAARPMSPPARSSRSPGPARSCPTARSWARRSWRGVKSSGMILAEDEVGISDAHSEIMVLGDGAAPGRPARRLPADRRRGPRAGDHAEPARLPGCLRRRARGARGHGQAARAGPERRGCAAAGRRHRRGPLHGRDRPRDLPPLHRARVRGREDRPVAVMAQAATDGGRAAADQQRRRHHQLRDAHDRPAAARVRPGQGAREEDRRAPGAAWRAHADPRRGWSGSSTSRSRWSATRRAHRASPGSWAARSPRSRRRRRAC